MRSTGRLNEFADLLAEGLTIKQCAERMSVSPTTCKVLLHEMRKRLGAQAV